MNRKEFLQKSAVASLGLFSLPFMGASCQKENIFEGIEFKGKVLIIGAGAAGLYAGYLLHKNNVDFQIIEASGEIGGRMGKLESFADFPLDTGAQWLHGKKSVFGNFINDKNVTITKDNSDTSYWFKNELVNSLPKNIESEFEGNNLPDISFENYAKELGYDDAYKNIVEGLAGDFGADASRLSVYWSNKEFENWSSGDADYKFQKTLFDVFNDFIIPEISAKIIVNSPINLVSYNDNGVLISDTSGKQFTGDYAIITVPITILKENYIKFSPELPLVKLVSFKKIGMDAGMKVFLKFTQSFYHENILGGKFCAAYADEKVGKKGNDHVLMAFIMGKQAEYLSSLSSDNEIISILLAELDDMYNGKASKYFVKGYVKDWYKAPFIKGAYSYSTVNIGNARAVSAESVSNKLFFAGEAMNTNGHSQTVHGAMETGEKSVKAIAQLLK